MPTSRKWRRCAPSSWLSAVSRPAAGSSSSSSFGAAARARATPTSLRWPCGSSLGRRSAKSLEAERGERPVDLLLEADRAAAGARGRARNDHHFGRLGRDEQVVADGEVLEQLERLARAGQAEAGPPVGGQLVDLLAVEARRALVTSVKPVMASMNVVLPAPFGPISPTSLPGSTSEVDAVVGGQAAVATVSPWSRAAPCQTTSTASRRPASPRPVAAADWRRLTALALHDLHHDRADEQRQEGAEQGHPTMLYLSPRAARSGSRRRRRAAAIGHEPFVTPRPLRGPGVEQPVGRGTGAAPGRTGRCRRGGDRREDQATPPSTAM